MKHRACLWIIFGLICVRPCINGQDTIKIKKLINQVEFDGKPFEHTWEEGQYFPMTMHQPNFGGEPIERTDLIMAYDNEYLWIAARLFMKDPSKIVVYGKKRDDRSIFYDSFNATFDTYNDNENALVFHTNPSGLRADYSIQNDGVLGSASIPFNPDWNTFWDVKTSRDDKGWYVEMRIPFSSLKFKPQNNITTMGFIARRFTSYNHALDSYPALDPKYGTSKPSMAATIQFEGIRPSNPVYISPYIIGGYTRNWVINNDETEYVNDDTPDYNAGIDIKYNINSNLTLDLTANTDFAQVEADDQQVNLTRYSLYFPEKRMFFQERSSLFTFNLGGSSNLFYSRNIGLSQGNSVSIYGGARLVGRIGKLDIGILDMQTEDYKNTPSENFGVLRLRRQVINPNSFIGGIFTSRIGMNGTRNFAYGLDGVIKIFGNDYLNLKAAQTYDDAIGNKINSLDPMFISARWERRTERSFGYSLEYTYSGEEFKPGLGFVNRPSLQGFSGSLSLGWVPGEKSKFFTIMPSLTASRYTRLEDGKLELFSVSPGWSFETKSGYKAELSLEYQQEGVLDDFRITDSILVMAGNYEFTNATLAMNSPQGKHFSTSLNINGGMLYDGQKYSLTVKPVYNISASIMLTGSYQYNHIVFPDRKKEADIHIASGKVLYMLNTKLSASLFIQYVSTVDNIITNFRIRFNPREGNDFYLVLNDYRSISNAEFVPALPDYYNRTILLKYTHTFKL